MDIMISSTSSNIALMQIHSGWVDMIAILNDVLIWVLTALWLDQSITEASPQTDPCAMKAIGDHGCPWW